MTPAIQKELAAALRQYRHNDGTPGFVFAYETTRVDQLIDELCDEIETLRQYGNRDCTAMADEALVTPPSKSEPNQCDGCARGIPLDEHGHHGEYMVCTADRYAHPTPEQTATNPPIPKYSELLQLAEDALCGHWSNADCRNLRAAIRAFVRSEDEQTGYALAEAHEALKQLQEGCEGQEAPEFGNVGGAKALADIVRRHLTASGVPDVPECIGSLPQRWRGWAQEKSVDERIVIQNCADDLDHELEAALAAAPADEYKLVPVEPTDEMLLAGMPHICKSVTVKRDEYGKKIPGVNPQLYRAMIAAAPQRGGE